MTSTLQFNVKRTLAAVWICFVLRGAFYCVLFPVWEGYDEFAHFGFIEYVAAHRALPTVRTPVSKGVEESLRLLPLPWMLRDLRLPHAVHDEFWKLPPEERQRRREALVRIPSERFREPGSDDLKNWEAQQPPLYYWMLSGPLRLTWGLPLASRVLLLRFLSVLLASLVVPVGFHVARRLLASEGAALAATAVIALLPELMVDICRVGNESLAVLQYALLLYAALRLLEPPHRLSVALLLGASLGAGLLTKAYFLTALPAVAVVLAASAWSVSSLRPRILPVAGLVFGTAAVLSGWWYWRNRVMTGSWSGVMPDVVLGNVASTEVFKQVPRVDWGNALDAIFLSHVWFGNWSFLQVRSWIYHVFLYASLLSIVGLAALFIGLARGRGGRFDFLRSPGALGILAVVYGSFWAGILYHVLITYVAQGVSASQGWYLYGVVVAEVLLAYAGLAAMSPRRFRPWIWPAAGTAIGLLDLYTVHFLFVPYYSGLIAHRANGTLSTFHAGRFLTAPWVDVAGRLALDEPWLGAVGALALWACYFLATAVLMAVLFLCSRFPDELSHPHYS